LNYIGILIILCLHKVVGPRDVELSPDDIITAPDGGWGWVIVFIAFMSNMFVDGIIFSFGIIQNEIIRLYEVNGRGNDPEVSGVAWVGSLILGFNFLSGKPSYPHPLHPTGIRVASKNLCRPNNLNGGGSLWIQSREHDWSFHSRNFLRDCGSHFPSGHWTSSASVHVHFLRGHCRAGYWDDLHVRI